ncbi:hypothetical protein C6372_02115 [Bacillus halotolerans]|nr:hypothetical protein C6372_02115 [Bacillus halotolerans]
MSEARGRKIKTAIEAEWKAPGGKSGSSHAKQVPPRKKHYAHAAKKTSHTLLSGISKVKSLTMRGKSLHKFKKYWLQPR